MCGVEDSWRIYLIDRWRMEERGVYVLVFCDRNMINTSVESLATDNKLFFPFLWWGLRSVFPFLEIAKLTFVIYAVLPAQYSG